ncbi:MAG: putative Ig domain-containing protein [Blastocatellia bacterium]
MKVFAVRGNTNTFPLSFPTRASRWLCIFLTILLTQAGILGLEATALARALQPWPAEEVFTLPTARAGSAYVYQFRTEGGLAPLKWRIAGGALPVGLQLEENGKVSGAPVQAQASAYAFVVEVADASQPPQRFSLPCLLTVNAAPLRIVTGAPPLRIVQPRAEAAADNNRTGSEAEPFAEPVPEPLVPRVRPAASNVSTPVAQASQEIKAPVLLPPLYAGVDKIRGTADAETVTILINDADGTKEVTATVANGSFSKDLTKPLAAGDKVTVRHKVKDLVINSQTVVVTLNRPLDVKGQPKPSAQLKQPLLGATTVSGTSFPGAEITVLVKGKPVKLIDEEEKDPAKREKDSLPVKAANGNFTFTLAQPLPAGKIATVVKDADGNLIQSQEIAIQEIGDMYDWGRVRAYFSGGVIFSKERDAFSQQDMLLGFNLDKNWWQAKPESKSPIKGFNTFFDTRLTSIPVVTTPSTTTTTTTTTLQTSQACDPGGGGIDCFLASRKVAVMQVGGYVPMYGEFMKWRFDNHDNAIFIAPLGKFGIQTVTSREVDARLAANNTTATETLNGDDVFNFFAFGTRLGHYRLADRDRSPELISYIDLTFGKWENFELLRKLPCTSSQSLPTGFTCPGGFLVNRVNGVEKFFTVRDRQFRTGFEGRLRIPQTPLFIGFDANFGKGPDDLRFLFGTRFDVGKLFGQLKTVQKLGN